MGYKMKGHALPGPQSRENKSKSPAKSWLDKVQTGLSVAGMVPVIGNLADAANVAVSGGRAGYAKYKGDDKGAAKHAKNAAINAAAMVPGAGQAVTATKLAAKGGKALAKGVKEGVKATTKKELGKKIVKKGTVTGTKAAGDQVIDKKSIDKSMMAKNNQDKKGMKPSATLPKPGSAVEKAAVEKKVKMAKKDAPKKPKPAPKKQAPKPAPKKVAKSKPKGKPGGGVLASKSKGKSKKGGFKNPADGIFNKLKA